MTTNYFDNYLDLFVHPGWVQLMRESQEVYDSLNYEGCKTHQDFLEVQAARKQLNKILRFESLIRLSVQQLEEEDNDSV